jgi:drug/metabolite transporter (DMT)-like permease
VRPIDYLRLLLLGAIWGGSFVFLRKLAPEFGALPTASGRVLLGGLVLLVYLKLAGISLEWRRYWRSYCVVAVLSCAIPFSLFAFAATRIPAAFSAIFNSSTSLFVAVLAVFWLSEAFTTRKLAGLALGISGVVLVAYRGGTDTDGAFYVAVAACLGASVCYALVGIFVRNYLQGAPAPAVASCSQLIAACALLPLCLIDQPGHFDGTIALNLVGLAVLSSAIAYLLYYRLIADVGPTRALTVTFLQPVFAMIWGTVFLGESVTAVMLLGCGLVLAGTVLVTNSIKPIETPLRVEAEAAAS